MTRSKIGTILITVVALGALAVVIAAAWIGYHTPRPGHVLDEALSAGRDAATFPAADEDYFADMDRDKDGKVALRPEEVKGRNTWIVWTAGDDRLWDVLTVTSVGAVDFLKVLSSHPTQPHGRRDRWNYYGLVNEPCFDAPTKGSDNRWGLWLDTRKAGCPSDPFENATKYPGVQIGSRGKTLNGKPFDVGSYYGYATGIVGLRLFPNPNFDEKAAAHWDAEKYYTDPTYYNDKDLVRPYRVGMSCGFCHIGPNPINPPTDPENPEWANISSNVGAQYFWTDRIFYPEADDTNFAFQLFHTFRPGTLDTSFVSTDSIGNPRTMNAVYNLLPRVLESKRWGKEKLAGGGLNNHQFNDYVQSGPLTQFFQAPDTVWTPRVLKDGADSVGVLGALNRVYLNIGTFSEEWLLHFNALVGGKPISPIPIETARKNSAFFKATEAQTLDMARFFLRTTGPHHLADAPDGKKYLTTDNGAIARGKNVFAENCARCHSSKLPPMVAGLDPDGCTGPNYMKCWNTYWASTQTEEFKKQMRDIVNAPDFLDGNYLSAEFRVPVTLLETNACSPLATNGIEDNIWDNFTSRSYKDLPSVGSITYYDPYTAEPHQYEMPAGGRGYTRPPSLVSVWSSAPFLLNNTVGHFEASPSVEARMRAFDDGIEKMLWPEKREKDSLLGDKLPGVIDRVGDRLPPGHETRQVYLKVSAGYLPDVLANTQGLGRRLFPWLFGGEGIQIGPIPRGTPIGLLGNLKLLAEGNEDRVKHDTQLGGLLLKIIDDLKQLGPNATDDQARAVFAPLVPKLLALSKCPDLVVNRGHKFGTTLPDEDKRALIALLKTF
jgi:hypothetical protein